MNFNVGPKPHSGSAGIWCTRRNNYLLAYQYVMCALEDECPNAKSRTRTNLYGDVYSVLCTSPEDLLTLFSTQDETEVPHLVPDSKPSRTSETTLRHDRQRRKSCEVSRQVMETVFWDTERLLCVDFLDYGINMNWEYYASLLKQL